MTNRSVRAHLVASLALTTIATSALASPTPLFFENFETPGDYQGWTVNGNQMIDTGPGGSFMHLPLDTFFGVHLRNDTASPMTGDLSRHGGPIRFTFDMRTFNLFNFNGDDIDTTFFPLVLELVDYGDPNDFTDDVSVYVLGETMPSQDEGWQTRSFVIPDPTSLDLPAGWGGTGDEDPVTFEPRLPADRTYADVLASVDEFRITTFVPGFFYGFNFWEIGFDNVGAEVIPAPSGVVVLAGAGLLAGRRRRK